MSPAAPGDTHPVRRLLPDGAETTVAAQLAELDLKELAHPDRPYLILNFATTLDGRAAVDGTSGRSAATPTPRCCSGCARGWTP